MILLAGADLVLPDRVLPRASLIIDEGRIAAIEPRVIDTPQGAERVDLDGSCVVPGFVDVHVHGVEGHDVLDGTGAVAAVAARLPRYGVTAFCPTTVACDPAGLQGLLEQVGVLREAPQAARVLPAHLESNFISADYRGAQPLSCLRSPVPAARTAAPSTGEAGFSGEQILATIARYREQVGIVTIAPELAGGIELVRRLAAAGHRVSIGHTGATYEQTLAAIDAGASHATHLFNRMSPMTHRAPGAPGAILRSEQVRAEVICDGFHVHPAMLTLAIRAKGARGVMAITDGTAGAGLPVGTRTRLGGRPIVVTPHAAELEDGTLAGSTLTMDRAFRLLIESTGVSVVEAARMCATTPAEQVGLADAGRIAVGATADLTVLDGAFRVRATYLRGQPWRNPPGAPLV